MMSGRVSRLISYQRRCHAITEIPKPKRTLPQRLYLAVAARLYPGVTRLIYGAFLPVGAKIGEGLELPHGLYGVFISQAATIGNNVTMLHHVTIGSNIKHGAAVEAPEIGDGVFIGCNTVIIGRCWIGAGARIGAGVTLINATIAPGSVIVNKSAYDLTHSGPV